jgi:hypothetical protein
MHVELSHTHTHTGAGDDLKALWLRWSEMHAYTRLSVRFGSANRVGIEAVGVPRNDSSEFVRGTMQDT